MLLFLQYLIGLGVAACFVIQVGCIYYVFRMSMALRRNTRILVQHSNDCPDHYSSAAAWDAWNKKAHDHLVLQERVSKKWARTMKHCIGAYLISSGVIVILQAITIHLP